MNVKRLLAKSVIAAVILIGLTGSLLAALLGWRPPTLPTITFGLPTAVGGTPSQTTYVTSTGAFTVTATAQNIDFGSGPIAIANGSLAAALTVNNSGVLTGPYTALDLTVSGSIDVNNDSVPDFAGSLLTGKVVAFGFQNTPTTDFFDLQFRPTGGALVAAGYFKGKDIGLALNSENNSLSFTGTFTRNFSGNAKGTLGVVPPKTVCTGAIGDWVFLDKNRNGIQDAGDTGINGIPVKLTDEMGQVWETTTANGGPGSLDGYYQFAGLCAGRYTVEVDESKLPPGYYPTAVGIGSAATDSNGSPAFTTLPADNSTDQTIDFGYQSPCTGAIGDLVWDDRDRDGIQDVGEPGIAGVKVKLITSTGTVETTTGADGKYEFPGLCADQYRVEYELPTGFVASPTNQTTPDLDSDESGVVVVLGNDENNRTIDFGVNRPCDGTIGDFVWNDLNQDGIQDIGEPGIAGVTVYLRDSHNVLLATAITDANGYYAFTSLCAGSYRVDLDASTLPATAPGASWAESPRGAGDDEAVDSNGTPAPVTLADDFVDDVTIDFGYYLAQPSIDIEKYTNGEDADAATGPVVAVGSTVTWTYVVTNTGNVPLSSIVVTDDKIGTISCPAASLEPGAAMTCTATGLAVAGQYANVGTTTGEYGTTTVSDSDASHYFAAAPAVALIKMTNGSDNDTPTGPYIPVGNAVTWTYVVTNTGNVKLTNIALTDDIIGAVSCPQTTLEPLADMTCTATGVAIAGQYANVGTVTANGPLGDTVTATNPDHYFGSAPSIELVKLTNGSNNDVAPGVYVPVGNPVTWTYEVKNSGNVTLTDVSLVDDRLGAVTCPKTTLAAGESMTCSVNGVATAGQYTNVGTVTGTPPAGANVSASNPDNYFGSNPSIAIVKLTNGTNNDVAPGVLVPVGSTVTWTYDIRNTGNVTLTNVVLVDNKLGVVSCPKNTLAPGESITCSASGIATAGQYTNVGTVTGTPPTGGNVSASNPDNYFGTAPALKLVKLTNGTDNNTPTGPVVPVGSTVTWTYTVTNTGNVPLANVVIRDDAGTPANLADDFTVCTVPSLAVGVSSTCTATGTAVAGQYENWATATGKYGTATVTVKDVDHYYGKLQWADETATSQGIRYPNTSNWFMYTPYSTSKVDLIAGQFYDAGDIYMTRTSTATIIKIVFHAGWQWAPVAENLKVQPFASAPKTYYAPGSFAYKFTVSGNTVTVTIPGTDKFYGIHGDVQRKLR